MCFFGYTTQSDRFNKPDADVTFKSSDSVLFALHKKNLATHSGFPPANDTVEAEIVELPENSETLELLFQYLYPEDATNLPYLADIPFSLVMKLLEAAEKYAVYIAIPLCKMRMLIFVRDCYDPSSLAKAFHPMIAYLDIIISHAATHTGYMSILDEAAPLVAVSGPLDSSLALFPATSHVHWVLYREQWADFQRELSSIIASHKTACYQCRALPNLTFGFRLLAAKHFRCQDSHLNNLVTSKLHAMKKFSTISGEVPRRVDDNTSHLKPVKQSVRFTKPDADFTFRSSDGVLFSLHMKNLTTRAGGFKNVKAGLNVLPEDSETLELLFQFLYPEDMPDIPDLVDISFTLLMKLTDAAETYMVYTAIPFCKMRVLFHLRSYYTPVSLQNLPPATLANLKQIVKYSGTHVGYIKILDEAAPLLAVTEPLETSLALFPEEGQLPWAVYREQWADLYRELLNCNNQSSCWKCTTRAEYKLDSRILTLDNSNIASFQCSHGEDAKGVISLKIRNMRKYSDVYNAVLTKSTQPYSMPPSTGNMCRVM